MNAIFTAGVILALTVLTFIDPEAALSAFLNGGENAFSLTLKLVVVYCVWLGVFGILEASGLDKKFAKLLRPVNKLLFGTLPEKAEEYISLNISANVLGMSGVTTPMGIKSVRELEKYEGTGKVIATFFVVNATSIQLIPTSVISLRSSFGSVSPSDVVLPTVLATALSTVIGVLLVKAFVKK